MEVFSFGNGDFLFQIFSAIVGIMGDGSYNTLMRIAILFGVLFLIYQLLFSMNIVHISKSIVAYVLFFFIVHGFMFIPKTNIVIRDEIKNTQVVVNNVPYGVGVFAHIFTTVERGLTRMMENYFSTPNDIRFNRAGYAFSVMLLDSFKDVVPRNPYFKQTLDDYVENCFFHDVLWGDKDLQQVVFSNNLWSMMSPQNSANKYVKIYSQSYPAGQATSCSNAYSHLSGQLNTISTEAINTVNSIMQTDIALKTPAVMNYLLGVSMSANQAITQAVAANAVKSSFSRTALHVGPGAGAIPYASAIAEQTQRSSWTVAGDLSKKYIPIMRQVLEAFVYGLFPILFIMMLTPFGSKYIRTYLTLLLWLLLWSPLFAIINLIVNVRANGVLSASYTYFGIGSMPYVYQSASELTAMAGYMAWMVPTMAFAIAKGSEYAITSLASSVASSASFTAKSAASNITDPSSAEKIASFAATAESFQAYGGSAAQGMAANKFFQIQQGMAMAASGRQAMKRVVDTEWSARNIDAEKLGEIAGKHGMTVAQAQGLMASDKYQQGITSAGARKAFAEDFAKQHGTSAEAGYQFLADTHMAGSRAINEAWNGNVGAYVNFLKAGYDLSIGQQKGIIQAAEFAGINLRDYAQMTSFMEGMRKVGALDKYMNGEISANDLRLMGAMGLLSEKGLAQAAERMSQALNMPYDQVRANLSTREGLNEYAKFEMRDLANRMLGGDSSDTSFYKYSMGVHASDNKTLTAPEAQNLTKAMRDAGYKNFSAKEGDRASFAFNPETGKFSMAYAERGGRSQTYDVSGYTWGSREEGGNKRDVTNTNYTGNRAIRYNENTAQGVFAIKDPNTGQAINVHGTFQFDPQSKQLVAAQYTNLQTGEIFTAQQVTDRGQSTWQYGVGKTQIGPDGRMVQTFTSLSSREVATGGYASQQTFAPDGTKLYERADAGQQVNWWHQFKMNFEKGANLSLLGAVAPVGSDLTNLESWKTTAIYGGGVAKVTVDRAKDGVLLVDKYLKANKPNTPSPANAPQNINTQKPTLYDQHGRPIN